MGRRQSLALHFITTVQGSDTYVFLAALELTSHMAHPRQRSKKLGTKYMRSPNKHRIGKNGTLMQLTDTCNPRDGAQIAENTRVVGRAWRKHFIWPASVEGQKLNNTWRDLHLMTSHLPALNQSTSYSSFIAQSQETGWQRFAYCFGTVVNQIMFSSQYSLMLYLL